MEDTHDGMPLHRLCKGTIGVYHMGVPSSASGLPFGVALSYRPSARRIGAKT